MAGRRTASDSARFAMRFAGARVLREPSREVRRDELGALQPLLRAMERLISKENAQGLSAPQLGVGVRLFMLARDADDEAASPLVAVNPKIMRRSRERQVEWEACLSVPEYAALVSRPMRVTVAYEDLNGAPVETTLSGNRARVFQHEMDHLDGIMYTSRMIASSFTHVSMLHDEAARDAIEEAETQRMDASDDVRLT